MAARQRRETGRRTALGDRPTRPGRRLLRAHLAARRAAQDAEVHGGDPYAYEDWEGLRVAEGSATVALRTAAELGRRIRKHVMP
ncbi:hypothetical protein ABZ851_13325 [Streptomyces sp. NPDC047049]|uniref:hypothetical protein n=1 Tax=Streptomyces sp. NPDC047049 TaxID=3156688 RepID=UPI0033D29A6B